MVFARKLLVLLLTFVIMLCSIPVFGGENIAAVETTTNLTPDTYLHNVELLSALDIYRFSDAAYDAEVTRSVFAQMIMDLMGYPVEEEIKEEYFIDVNADTDYASAVNAITRYGLMDEMEKGKFFPDGKVTYGQAIQTIVCALGYGDIAEGKGGYPKGYIDCAMKIRILKNAPSDYNTSVTYEMASELLYLAAETPIFEPVGIFGGKIIYTGEKDRLLLNVYHDIYINEGIMTDNGVTAVNGKSKNDIQYVKIGERILYNTSQKIRNYIGCNLRYYYSDSGDMEKILYAEPRKTKVITLNASQLMTGSDEFSARCVVAEINGKTEKFEIDPYANVLYNGAVDKTFTVETLKIAAGELRLIDANLDEKYELACVEEYVDIVAQRYVEDRRTVVAEYGPEAYKLINFDDYQFVFFEDEAGNNVDANIIKAEDVISVFESKNREKLRFVICSRSKDFTVDEVEKDNDTVIVKYSDQSAELSDTYNKLWRKLPTVYPQPQAGESYKAYMDYEGRIAMLIKIKGKSQYAYLLGIANGKGLRSDEVNMKFFLESNEVAILTAAKKISIDKQPKKSGRDLYNDNRIVFNGKFKPQLVRITTNFKGELTEIEIDDTADSGLYQFNLDKFSLDYVSGANVEKSSGMGFYTVNGGHNVTSKTKIFVIKDADETLETTDETMIEVLDYSRFHEIRNYTYYKLYDSDETWAAGAAVVSAKTGIDQLSRFYFVDDVKVIVNEDGEEVTSISSYYQGTYITKQECRPGLFKEAIARRYPGAVGNVQKGDLLTIGSNLDGTVCEVNVIYSPQRDNNPDYSFIDTSYGGTFQTGDIAYSLGFLCANDGARLSVYYKKNDNYLNVLGGITPSPEYFWVTGFTAGGTMMHYDCSTKELKKIKIDDFVGTANLGPNGFSNYDTDSKIFIGRFKGIAFDAYLVTGLSNNY